MDKFDQYVENTLIPKYTAGKQRAYSKQYQAIVAKKHRARKQKNWVAVKKLEKLAQRLPSLDPLDPDFRRLYFCRYADDVLFGLIGNKTEAESIKSEITIYLQNELKLQLNQEKTLITHARSEYARFLGYDIEVMHNDTKHDKSGRRSINGVIGLRVPRDRMQKKMSQYKAKGKPIHRAERMVNSAYDIVSQFQAEFRGFVQYYMRAYNAHQMSVVKRVMELSLAKTLAGKFRTTTNKIFRRYLTTAETMDGRYKVLEVVVEREGRRSLVAQFGGIALAYDRGADIVDVADEVPRQFLNKRSQLIDRLLRDVCELCGAKDTAVQMHHIRKLKDLIRKDEKCRPEWVIRMIAMRRKTLAVCTDCHCKIHSGLYDGVRVR